MTNATFRKFHKQYGILLTDEPINDQPLSKALEEDIAQLYELSQTAPRLALPIIKRKVEEHPEIPSFRNFLYVAYRLLEQRSNAMAALQQSMVDHPDYLHAIINYVTFEPDKRWILKEAHRLGPNLSLTDWPDHKGKYHVTEFVNFERAAIPALIFQGEFDEAKTRMNRLLELGVDADTLEFALDAYQMETMAAFRKRQQHTERNAIHPPHRITVTTSVDPNLVNYTSGNEVLSDYIITDADAMTTGDIAAVTALPRDVLVPALRQHLRSGLAQYMEYRRRRGNLNNYDDNDVTFMIIATNALYMLAILEATEAVQDVLDYARVGGDCFEYFFGDVPEQYYEPPLFALTKDKPGVLADYLLEPDNFEHDRVYVANVLANIAHHFPDQRAGVLGCYVRIWRAFLDYEGHHPALDTYVLSSMIGDAVNLRATELMPLIRELAGKGWLQEDLQGDLADLEKEVLLPYDPYYRIPQPAKPIEYFNQAYLERRPKSNRTQDLDAFRTPVDQLLLDRMLQQISGLPSLPKPKPAVPQTVVRTEKKVGRNEPCPCGSGRKFKKCCINK